MQTLKVYWPDKFGDRQVTIDAADFDSAKHSLEPPKPAPIVPSEAEEAAEVEAVVESSLNTHTVAELREIAAVKGVELKSSMTKTAIIEAIQEAEG